MNQSDRQNDLRRMIESYAGELMAQYASVTPSASVAPPVQNPQPTLTENAVENASQETNELIDTGYMQIRVTTENQAIPLIGAVVNVSHDFGDGLVLDFTEITDQNGQTRLLPLATKDRRLSLTPESPTPYAIYRIDVVSDGYFTKHFENVPIYGGVTSFQNVSMIPLPEAGDPNESITYSTPAPF